MLKSGRYGARSLAGRGLLHVCSGIDYEIHLYHTK